MVRGFTESGLFDPDKPIAEFTEQELSDFLYKEPTKIKIQSINMTYEGLVPKITQVDAAEGPRQPAAPHPLVRGTGRQVHALPGSATATQLNDGARSSKIEGVSIADACGDADRAISPPGWTRSTTRRWPPLIAGLRQTVSSFLDIGLGYLSRWSGRPERCPAARRSASR